MKKEKARSSTPPHGDIPATVFGYRVEIAGGGEGVRILVSGVRRILSCEEGEVVLTAGRETLSFRGSRLVCLALEGGILEITGRLFGCTLGKGDIK